VLRCADCLVVRVGQNCIYTPYMTVHLVMLPVMFLPKVSCMHHIYICQKYHTCSIYICFWQTLLVMSQRGVLADYQACSIAVQAGMMCILWVMLAKHFVNVDGFLQGIL